MVGKLLGREDRSSLSERHAIAASNAGTALLHPVILKHVSRTYRLESVDVPALVDVNLIILPNRFTVISGPSGSGKTTLLNLIGCIDRPDAGTVMVGGKPVQQLSDDELSDFRARHLGFIFQNFNLIPVL